MFRQIQFHILQLVLKAQRHLLSGNSAFHDIVKRLVQIWVKLYQHSLSTNFWIILCRIKIGNNNLVLNTVNFPKKLQTSLKESYYTHINSPKREREREGEGNYKKKIQHLSTQYSLRILIVRILITNLDYRIQPNIIANYL